MYTRVGCRSVGDRRAVGSSTTPHIRFGRVGTVPTRGWGSPPTPLSGPQGGWDPPSRRIYGWAGGDGPPRRSVGSRWADETIPQPQSGHALPKSMGKARTVHSSQEKWTTKTVLLPSTMRSRQQFPPVTSDCFRMKHKNSVRKRRKNFTGGKTEAGGC